MSKRYTIEQITDIYQIPEDKFDDFLEDFQNVLHAGAKHERAYRHHC